MGGSWIAWSTTQHQIIRHRMLIAESLTGNLATKVTVVTVVTVPLTAKGGGPTGNHGFPVEMTGNLATKVTVV